MSINVENELDDYKVCLQKIAMLKNDLDQLERLVRIKTTSYTDETPGQRLSMHDKYEKMIEEKESLKYQIAVEEMKVSRIEKALELLYVTHPSECNAIKLRYIQNRSIVYVQQEIGYSESQTIRKIKDGKVELKKILSVVLKTA